MQNFESIRPYRDDEVPVVIQRLAHDPALLNAAAAFFAPRLARWLPWAARYGARRVIQRRTAGLDSVRELQLWLADYMGRVIRDSVHELTVDGLDALQPTQPYLFVSNHRDIFMDSALLNYSLHQAGHATMRVAVGDNLLSEAYAADLMRLNKSFVIERSVSGARALYQAITRTSDYIRHSIEEGQSIWIAQREGRAKDGFDRTDPAVLKMLSLAYRKEIESFGGLLDRVALIPVSVSYELDPCDRRKAHELYVAEQKGRYDKHPGEDLASMVDGILGFKGRVHVQISPPLRGDFADPEAMAHGLDAAIVGGLRIYPTQVEALRRQGDDCQDSVLAPVPRVMRLLEERIAACPEPELPYLLGGYANPIRNRRTLGVA